MKEKINILYVTFSLDMGGLENMVLELIKRLDPHRFSPFVCTFQKNGKLMGEFRKSGIPVFDFEKKEGLDFALPLKIARLASLKKIDIIHTNNASPWLYSSLSRFISKSLHIVHTEHSHVPPEKRRLIKAENIISKISDYIVADSDCVARFLLNDVKISRNKLKVIYNGVDIDKFNIPVDILNKKRAASLGESDSVIGIVARLVPVKEHATLLKAFAIVMREVKSARLLIIGDGELKDNLINLAAGLSIAGSVRFLGTRFDIPELLKIMDLFIISSLNEGFSMALLEAMAAGLPVIATNVGGNPEIVLDGATGVLVPPQDPDKMAEAIIKLLKDKGLAGNMGRAGKKRVSEEFNLEKMKDNYQDLYEECIHGPQKYGKRIT